MHIATVSWMQFVVMRRMFQISAKFCIFNIEGSYRSLKVVKPTISYEFVQCELYKNVRFLEKSKHEGPSLTPSLILTASMA